MTYDDILKLSGPIQTFLTKHGEIIIGRIESQTNDKVTIKDRKGDMHSYPMYWLDIGENRNNTVHGTAYNTFDRKAKKLIIIGAGASYDFSTNLNIAHKLPLSNSLFKDDHFNILKSHYPRIQANANTLAAQENLEKRLLKLYQRAKVNFSESSVNLLLEINYYLAEIFLLFSLSNQNEIRSNYLSLVNAISEYLEDNKDEEIIIINFNYDTLLDNAIERVYRMAYSHPNDYLGSEALRIKMFKVHGSCNWIRKFVPVSRNLHSFSKINFSYRELPAAFQEREMHLGYIQNYLKDEITILNQNEIIPSKETIRLNIGPFFPHLLIPMNDKDDFMIPTNHQSVLKASLKNIDEIITVGWKGEEKALQSMFSLHDLPLKKLTIVDYVDEKTKFEIANFPFQNELTIKYQPELTYVWSGFSGYARSLANSQISLFDNNK